MFRHDIAVVVVFDADFDAVVIVVPFLTHLHPK